MGILTKNAAVIIALRILGAVLIFLIQIVLARLLGVTEYGVYSFVISWISIAALICTLGFDTSLARFLPEYCQSGNWSYFNGVIKYSFRVCLAFSMLVATLLFVIILLSDPFELRVSLMFALPLIIIIALSNVRTSSLRSLKKYVWAVFPETILRPSIFILLISAYYLTDADVSSHEAIIAQIIAAAVSLIVGSIYFRKVLINLSQKATPLYQGKYWLLSSMPMVFIAGSAYIISQTDIIMLGILKDMSHSGIYSAVSRLSEITIFFMAAVNFVVAPLISETYYGKEKGGLIKVVSMSTRISFALAFLSSIILVVFGTNFLEMFGNDFVLGDYALIILVIGHLCNAGVGPVGVLLTLTGNQVYAAKVMGVCALANVALNYLLIPEYGLIGAALSTSLSTVLWNLIMLVKVRHVLGISCSIVGWMANEKG